MAYDQQRKWMRFGLLVVGIVCATVLELSGHTPAAMCVFVGAAIIAGELI